MDGPSNLEVMFALEDDEELKTKIAVNQLANTCRQWGGDFALDGELNDGSFLYISVKISKEKLIHDGMSE